MIKNYNEILYANERIECERVILRRAKIEDAKSILERDSDPIMRKYLGSNGAQNIEEARAQIFNWSWSRPGIWAIEHKASDKNIGSIVINFSHAHDKASFGYAIGREFWNQGLMTEALSAVIKLCFEGLQLNRVEAEHFVGNEGIGRVMEKCGMVKEGVSRQSMLARGIYHDVVTYGIARDMWVKS